jgi:galactan 5-O-arabinofuranosyltransferase
MWPRGLLTALRPFVISAVGVILTTLVVRHWQPDPWRPHTTWTARAAVVGLVTLITVAVVLARRFSGNLLAGDIIAGMAASLVALVLATQLSGTPFLPFNGDLTFRMAAATRFAHTWHLSDYGYRGLPAAYPPLLPWLTGRAAAVVHTPGWMALKAASYAALAVMPPAAYCLWRRLLAPIPAALVAGSSVVIYVGYQPEEWLAVAVFVPWLLLVLATPSGRHTRREVVLGVIGGIIVPLYYFYFLPAVLIVLLAIAVSVVMRSRINVRSGLRVLAVVVIVSAWYWLPLLISLASSAHLSAGQTSFLKSNRVPTLLPTFGWSAQGILDWIGVVYLVVRFRADPVARGLAAIVAGSYCWIGLGKLSSHVAQNTLVYWRAVHIVLVVMLAAGVLGVICLVSLVRLPQRVLSGASVALAMVLGISLVITFANDLHASRSIALAHAEVLPDGTSPLFPPHRDVHRRLLNAEAGGHGVARDVEIANLGSAATTQQLWRALGGSAANNDVVLSTRQSLEWYYPLYFFNGWTPSYAHTAGGYVQRLRFLEQLAKVTDPDAFLQRFRHNRFQPIDSAVLYRGPHGDLFYVTRIDRFGHGTVLKVVRFHASQFPSSLWRLTDVPPYVVAQPLA